MRAWHAHPTRLMLLPSPLPSRGGVPGAKEMHGARLAAERGAKFPAGAGPTVGDPHLKPAVHVGCSGWFYWHWRDSFYPKGLPTSRWFAHYTRAFRTVELNAPFYSWPKVSTVRGWVTQAGRRRFVYTVKANELITHTKRFAGTRQLVRDFYFIGDLLGP